MTTITPTSERNQAKAILSALFDQLGLIWVDNGKGLVDAWTNVINSALTNECQDATERAALIAEREVTTLTANSETGKLVANAIRAAVRGAGGEGE